MDSTTRSKASVGVIVGFMVMAAILVNILAERPSNALSFGDVSDFIKTLLTTKRGEAPIKEPSPPAQENTIKQPGSDPKASSTGESDAASYKAEPLSKVAPITVNVLTVEQLRGDESNQSPVTNLGVVPKDSPAMILQATPAGWQLLGLMWYWWLGGLVAVVLMSKLSAYYIKIGLSHALISRTTPYLLLIAPMLNLDKT